MNGFFLLIPFFLIRFALTAALSISSEITSRAGTSDLSSIVWTVILSIACSLS